MSSPFAVSDSLGLGGRSVLGIRNKALPGVRLVWALYALIAHLKSYYAWH
jgi:hypothetical protein